MSWRRCFLDQRSFPLSSSCLSQHVQDWIVCMFFALYTRSNFHFLKVGRNRLSTPTLITLKSFEYVCRLYKNYIEDNIWCASVWAKLAPILVYSDFKTKTSTFFTNLSTMKELCVEVNKWLRPKSHHFSPQESQLFFNMLVNSG